MKNLMFKIFISLSLTILNLIVVKANSTLAQDPSLPIEIEKISLIGNKVFSDSELNRLVAPLEGKKVSLERLLQLRTEITDYYVERGYISSGAFLPPQELTDGTIEIQIVEGKLETIEIEGSSHINKRYIESRLPVVGKPLKTEELTRALALLKDNPLIKDVKANLRQSGCCNQILSVKLQENKSLTTQFSVNNTYSPSVGMLGGTANLNYHLLGFGDRAALNFTKTEGLTRYNFGYSIPFNNRDGTISLNYTQADTKIIEEPVSALDIQANYEAFELGVRQPIELNENNQLAISAKIELIRSETFVQDDFSFAFVDGLEDGRSKITAIRLLQEYFTQAESSSLALLSQFNIGVDLFNPTVTQIGIDGLFWNWQGQIQWLKKIERLLVVSNLNVQLSDDKLLPIEQISVGGTNNVRGYRQNLSIGDNGVIGTVELQIPVVEGEKWTIKVIPFVDAGTIWNNSAESIESNTLASTGLGFSYELDKSVKARLDYAIPLVKTPENKELSSEQRVTFLLLLQP
jgi:hemolysin activation/secretion protein